MRKVVLNGKKSFLICCHRAVYRIEGFRSRATSSFILRQNKRIKQKGSEDSYLW